MIEVYGFTPSWGLPDISPFVTKLVNYLKDKYGDKLDSHLSESEKAVGLAFQRMVEENVYWSGVIYARWRNNEVFSVYLPSFVPPGQEPAPEFLEAMGAYREKIWGAAGGHGMGLRTGDDVLDNLKADLDALSAFLADKPFFMGTEPTSYDATVYSTFRHIADVPWDWAGRDYARSKANLVAYAERMKARYGV